MRRYSNNGISLILCVFILVLTVNTVCCISAKAQTYPEEHLAYCESDKYSEDITGYFGVLTEIHEYTKEDSTMLKYSIVDDLKKMITLDLGNLTGREEYEVLLAEIMMNDASLSGINNLYKKNLKNSIIEVAKYITNQFTDLAVDKSIQEPTKRMEELIVKMDELPYPSDEFSKTYEEYKDIVIKRADLKKAKKFSSYLGTAITAGNSAYESTENLLTTIEYGEAYKCVSDEFVTVLKKFRDKLNDKDCVNEIKKKYNITDPFFVDAMTKATNDFIDKMEQYKESGSIKVAEQALFEAGGKLVYDVGADKCSDFVRGIFPLVNGTLIVSEAGQLVMDNNPSIDFDRIAYSGNMFARLYYIEVFLKEMLDDLGNDLKNNTSEESAYLFDEGINIYKSVELTAEKYASTYVQKKIEEYQNTIAEIENRRRLWDPKLRKAKGALNQFTVFQEELTGAVRKTEAISCHGNTISEEDNANKNIGESIINGRAVDSETGKPLKGVKVECKNSSDVGIGDIIVSVVTDDNGHFKIEDLLKGETILILSHDDYEMDVVTKEIGSDSEEYDLGTINMRKKGQENKNTETNIIDDELEIYVGEEYALDYVVEGKDKNTTWTSSDESVATVSKKGKVKALKPGNTTITLEANYKSDSALISVLEPYIEADNLTITKGESRQLPYKIFGPKGDIKFSSADKNIASIDKQGVVTGHQAGNTQITLSANNVSTTVVVTVEEGNAWAKYIDENYASELGYASLDSASKTVGQNWNYPSVWDKRRGILGAQTADLDNDGIDECVIYYFDTKYVYEPGSNTITNDPKTTLYARVLYNNQNGEVVATPGRQIFFCDSISFCDAVGGILNVEGLKYVYFEVNTSGYYSNFGNTMYSFFIFDGKNFSAQMAAGKTGGGSSELEYGIIRSDESGEYTGANVTESSQAWYWEDGKYSKQLLCVDRDWHGKGGPPLMNNFDPEDAMKAGLESLAPIKVDKIKLENGPLSSYTTYRTNDVFSQGFHYNCNGRQGSNGARAMKITVEDNTGLRNYVTQSDNKAKQPEKSKKSENSEYILPFSNERYLTEADLDSLSEWELKLARNEIYARHGRRFIDPELQAYFDSKSWYKGIYDPQDFDKNHDSDISELEKKNAEFILKYEKDHNYFT